MPSTPAPAPSATPGPSDASLSAPAPPGVTATIAAASFAAVYLQVSLMKVASVMFTPLSVMAILGVALLGYGAAGSLLAARGVPAGEQAIAKAGGWLLAAGVVALPVVLAVNAVDLPAGVLFGTLKGLPALLATYAALTLPFALIGLAVSALFARFSGEANRLYFADLFGAGLGSLLAAASLPLLGGLPLPAVAGAIAAGAGALASRAAGRSVAPALAIALANVVACAVLAGWRPLEVRIAPDKHGPILAKAADPDGLAVDFSQWSVLGRVDVTEPFATMAPQMGGDVSPRFGDLRISQRMLTLDGQAPAFFFRVDRPVEELAYLGGTSQSAAYRLRANPKVLVIGVGGATDILIALHAGAREVTGVELSAVNVHAVRHVFDDWLGRVADDPRVRLEVAEGRNFAVRDTERYDVVQLSGVDTGAALGAYGLGTMPESYLYTVEAVRDLLGRLAPGGVLTITRDLRFGLGLRLAAVARAALLEQGLDPSSRIAVLEGKGWGWATILVRPDGFGEAETAALREFARDLDFPLAYDPLGSGTGEFARVIRDGVTSDGVLDLRPSTDDWPFFFMPVRWSRVGQVFREQTRPLTNPILFLLTSLLALAMLAVALIGWPLWRLRAAWRTTERRLGLTAYFTALGLGFMLVEVAFMQRFTVFLGHPMLTVSVVLAALLMASGLGSWTARRSAAPARLVRGALVAILVMVGVLATPLLGMLLTALMPLPLGARLAVAMALAAVPGFFMGMPFPYGLARVGARAPAFVPWAWSVNAMTSTLAALAGYFVGMVFGYTAMLLVGAACYAGALGLVRRL